MRVQGFRGSQFRVSEFKGLLHGLINITRTTIPQGIAIVNYLFIYLLVFIVKSSLIAHALSLA